jgi:UDP-GlcNAc3NAcA epimerase
MSRVFFAELEISEPAYNLGVGSAAHGQQTANMIRGIEKAILKEKPSAVVVYGDTNSTLAGAVAASKLHIPVVHIEAGMRSFNKRMPEEINRVLTDHVSTFLFSPTSAGIDNLIHEGFRVDTAKPHSIDNPGVFYCGDVMYDNCLYYAEQAEKHCNVIHKLGLEKKDFVLTTIHRDSNTDDPKKLHEIFSGLAYISNQENIQFVMPLHPRTRKSLSKLKQTNEPRWENFPGFVFIPPASYFEMLQLERHATIIITDSGGVQKEAYFCNKKCLVLRNETEWVELLEHGMLRLAGSSSTRIVKEYGLLKQAKFDNFPPIYGDGHAAEFICKVLVDNLV